MEEYDGGDDTITRVRTTVTNHRGRPIVTAYDGDGEALPDGMVDRYEIDTYADGWRHLEATQYDGDGRAQSRTVFQYNEDGRRTAVRYDTDANGTLEGGIYYEYDDAGRLVSKRNSTGTVRFRYDADGRLTQESHDFFSDGEVDFVTEYVWEGDVISVLRDDFDGDGVVDSENAQVYDDAGRLIRFMDDILGRIGYEYHEDTHWPRTEIWYGSGDHVEEAFFYEYSDNGRLREQRMVDYAGRETYIRFRDMCRPE